MCATRMLCIAKRVGALGDRSLLRWPVASLFSRTCTWYTRAFELHHFSPHRLKAFNFGATCAWTNITAHPIASLTQSQASKRTLQKPARVIPEYLKFLFCWYAGRSHFQHAEMASTQRTRHNSFELKTAKFRNRTSISSTGIWSQQAFVSCSLKCSVLETPG